MRMKGKARMESSKISIIVPVYKVEQYLERCVKSLINQTYKNIEIILVDDGSPDQCPKMCDDYASEDSRIKVIHKKNGGLSDARNAGLDAATGEFIAFVDSDDWVEIDFIETLCKNAKKENADISIIGCTLVWDNGRKKPVSKDKGYYVFNKEKAIKEMLIQRKFECMVCQKMYRKQIFDTVRFPVGKLYEDVAVSMPTFLRAKKVVVSGNHGYNYYQRNDSIVNSKFDERKLYFLECCQNIIKYSDKHEKMYDTEAHIFYLRALMMFALTLYQNSENEENTEYIEQEIKKNKKYIWNNMYLELRKKVILSLICIGFSRNILAGMWSKRINKNEN